MVYPYVIIDQKKKHLLCFCIILLWLLFNS